MTPFVYIGTGLAFVSLGSVGTAIAVSSSSDTIHVYNNTLPSVRVHFHTAMIVSSASVVGIGAVSVLTGVVSMISARRRFKERAVINSRPSVPPLILDAWDMNTLQLAEHHSMLNPSHDVTSQRS